MPSVDAHARNVLIFAAAGAVGSATARAVAATGATVWLSGRTRGSLDALAADLSEDGAEARVAVVDATDPDEVDAYVDEVAAIVASTGGHVDGVFNAIGITAEFGGYPAATENVDLDTFLTPLRVVLGSTFLTARAGARHMTRQGSGSIVTLTTALAGSAMPWMSGLTATSGAIEGLTRTLAAEYGVHGVRVNCVRADAMPETISIGRTAANADANGVTAEAFRRYVGVSLLGRPNSAVQTAATVSFLLSDAAAGITYQTYSVASRPLA